MDPLATYREAVMTVLRAWEPRTGPESTFRFETVFDRERDRYLLVMVGWSGHQHVHATLAHVEVIEGKLWILCDATETGVAPELVEAGVPRDRIVLGFKSPARRAITGYAVS